MRIPRKIYVGFSKAMKAAIFGGHKSSTTRGRKFLRVHDYFVVGNKKCTVYKVFEAKLETIAKNYYREEGFISPQKFIDYYLEMKDHYNQRRCNGIGKSVYNPTEKVWIHFFEVTEMEHPVVIKRNHHPNRVPTRWQVKFKPGCKLAGVKE